MAALGTRRAVAVGAAAVLFALLATILVSLKHNNDAVAPTKATSQTPVRRGRTRAEDSSALSKFDAWRESLASDGVGARGSDSSKSWDDVSVQEGVTLARARRSAMLNMISYDPEGALAAAVAPEEREGLPESVVELLEEWVYTEATIDVLCPYPVLGEHEIESEWQEALTDAADPHAGRTLTNKPTTKTTAHNLPEYFHTLTTSDGDVYRAYTYGRRLHRYTLEPTPVYGVAVGSEFALAEEPVQIVDGGRHAELRDTDTDTIVCAETGERANVNIAAATHRGMLYFADESAREAYVTREREADEARYVSARGYINSETKTYLKILNVIVKFSGENKFPSSTSNYDEMMDNSESFWYENSYGYSTVALMDTVQVSVPGTLNSYATSGCPIYSGRSDDLDDDALDAASAAGYDEGDYDRYTILFSHTDGCAWAGLGSIANSGTWINGYSNPTNDWHIAAHELGHNFGLKHADLQPGGSNSPIGNDDPIPYGDDFDVMGAVYISADRSSFHVGAEKKWGLDWLSDSEIHTIETSGQYRVYAVDDVDNTGTRGARVEQSGDAYYWIEYKPAIDYSNAEEAFDYGAAIHLGYDTGGYGTETDLLDMTAPYTQDAYSDLDDAPLALGLTYADTSNDVYITPVTIASSSLGKYMDVFVYVGTPSGNSDPVANDITFSCTGPEVDEAVLFIADVSDADLDSLAFHWNFGDGQPSTSNARAVTHAWSIVGQKSITVRVSDMRGGEDTYSVNINVKSAGNSNCPPCPAGCNGNGQCAGGACACARGWTGADCGTPLTVTKATQNYGLAAGGTPVTVHGAGFGDSDGGVLCDFEGVSRVSAVWVSDSEVTCTSPQAGMNMSVSLEVSPNGGLDWSNSDISFTYGGGQCPNNCTYNNTQTGVCDVGPGVCSCFDGYTGAGCDMPISVVGVSPSRGPSAGGSVVVVSVSGFSSVPTKPRCRFGSGGAIITGTYDDTAGEMTCTTPTYLGGVGSVGVYVSPNNKDWTLPLYAWEYVASAELVANLPTSSAVLSGDVAYYTFPVYDSSTSVTFTLSVSSGTADMYVLAGAVPESGVDTPATSFTFTSASVPALEKATYYVAVEGTGGGSNGITVTATYDESFDIPVGGAGMSIYVTPSAPVYFTFEHSSKSRASVVEVVPDSEDDEAVVYMSRTDADVSSSDAADAFGDFVTVQACDKRTTYYGSVVGDGVFVLNAMKVSPPDLYKLEGEDVGQVITTDRKATSVVIEWPYAYDSLTNDFDLRYIPYVRIVDPETEYNTPCLVKDTAEPSSDKGYLADSFFVSSTTVVGLKPSTNYEITLLVSNEYGVESAYTGTVARTKPPNIPIDVFIMMGAAAGACLTLAVCLVGYLSCCTKTHRRRRKRAKRRKKRAKRHAKEDKKAGKSGKGSVATIPPPKNGKKNSKKNKASAKSNKTSNGAAPSKRKRSKSRGRSRDRAAARKATLCGIALADFRPEFQNELPFKKGDVLTIITKAKAGWLKAELNGRVGLVPESYVKLAKVNDVAMARSLSKGKGKKGGSERGRSRSRGADKSRSASRGGKGKGKGSKKNQGKNSKKNKGKNSGKGKGKGKDKGRGRSRSRGSNRV